MNNFSVLLCVYYGDNPDHFKLALESIIDQSFIPGQIVIVKDGPINQHIENSINNLKLLTDIEITVISLIQNSGLGFALAEGLKFCKYDLVARMDADDISVPDRFKIQIDFMNQNPSISVLGTFVSEFKFKFLEVINIKKVPTNHESILVYSRYRNPINHPSVVFRKRDVLASGSYQDMPYFEDYFLWLRMLKLGYKFQNLDQSLLKFRIGNSMISRRHGIQYLFFELRFLKSIKDLNLISEAEYIFNIILKLPVRILPIGILELIYRKILR